MSASRGDIEFVDNANAPEFFANGCCELQPMGSVSRLIFYVLRRSPGGLPYKETCFSCIIPNEAINEIISTIAHKADAETLLSVAAQTAKLMM